MRKLLAVIDMQNDFIDGSLGTKEAVSIVPKVKECVEESTKKKYDVIFTRDTHYSDYLSTKEGKNLPVEHCIINTEGWQICKELIGYTNDKNVFDKPTFGSIEFMNYVKENNDDESVLVGLCTDICVISNAMLFKAALPEADIKVVANACAGVTVDSHNNALEAMKMCQIEVI